MKDRIRVMIVDDELPALDLLEKILSKIEEIEVIGRCQNGFETVKMSSELNPDLIFLDIEMPKLSGFDVVELLDKDKMPFIVFVTAYNEYAVEAFEREALDYILKPASKERIVKSIERIKKLNKINGKIFIDKVSNVSKENSLPISRVIIKNGTEINIINVDDIMYIKAEDDYIRIFTKERAYLKNGSLGEIENKIDKQMFLRVHRSYIININFLRKIEPYLKDSKIAILEGRIKIPISKSGFLNLKGKL